MSMESGEKVSCIIDKSHRLSMVEIVLLSISIGLALLADFKSIEMLEYIACAIPIIISVANPSKSLYVITYIFLNNTTLMMFGINVYTIIAALVMVEVIILRKKIIMPMHILVFIFYGVLQSALYLDFNLLFKEYIKVSLILVYFLNIFAINKDRRSVLWKNSLEYMIYGACVTSLLAIVMNRQGTQMLRFDISTNNSVNFVGIQMAILSIYAIIFFMFAKTGRKKYVLSLGIMSAIGLLTTSRTFIIAYIIGVALILTAFIFNTNSKRIKRGLVFSLVLIVIAVIAVKYTSLGDSFAYLIRRFVDPTNNDISNGRFDIWNKYVQAMKSDKLVMLLGAGSYSKLGLEKSAHNMFIEVFAVYGICGTALFVYSYMRTARALVNKVSTKFWYKAVGCIPLFIVVLTGISSHSLASFPSTMQFVMGVLAINNVSICLGNRQSIGGSNENSLGNGAAPSIRRGRIRV